MEFKPATRQNFKPVIALTGESNSGKTFSALKLARGIAGPTGKIVCIDTENMRAGLYVDHIEGGFLHGDFQPPFSPIRHIEVLDEAEANGATVIVQDSFSHEWEGDGGVCEMAAAAEEKSGRPGLHNWHTPKMDHKKLILRMQRGRVPVILCLRSMYKTRQLKDERGKTVIVKDNYLTPIQSDGFVYDATVILDMQRSSPGNFLLAKWSVPSILECFPGCGPTTMSPDKVSVEHGKALARWCAGLPPQGSPVTAPAPPADPLKQIKARLWTTVKADFKTIDDFQSWLHIEDLMDMTQKLGDLDLAGLEQLYARVITVREAQQAASTTPTAA